MNGPVGKKMLAGAVSLLKIAPIVPCHTAGREAVQTGILVAFVASVYVSSYV